LANLFPLLEGDDLDELAEDIKCNGLIEPVILLEGQVLDGRNRLRACAAAGVEPRFVNYDNAMAPLHYVVSRNLKRRHLTASQRAVLAAELVTTKKGDNQHVQICTCSQTEAAKLAGVSRHSVIHGTKVLRDGAPEVIQAVKSGTLPVSAAVKLVEAPVDEQPDILAKATEAAKTVDGKPKVTAAIVEATVTPPRAHVANNSGNDEYFTPSHIINAVRDVFEGTIDLDPASCEAANETVKAREIYTAEDDGLTKEWHGNVWMNPPFSQPLVAQFCAKLLEELDAGRVQQAIVIVNNATETKWGNMLLRHASMVCFPTGRVRFVNAMGANIGSGPLQGQMLVYFGKKYRFESMMEGLGPVLQCL